MKTSLVVMAAGMGSRYGGIKQLDPVGVSGEVILEFSLYDAVRAGFSEIVFIIRQEIAADFQTSLLDRLRLPIPYRVVYQEKNFLPQPWAQAPEVAARLKPWGTAHAVWCARQAVTQPFAVINADDFYGRESYQLLHDFLTQQPADGRDYAMAGYQLQNTLSAHGTVSRGICTVDAQGCLQSIEEHLKIERLPQGIVSHLATGESRVYPPETTISMNMFGFTPRLFDQLETHLKAFLSENLTNPKAECYLPVVASQLIDAGQVQMHVLPSTAAWFGITYREDKPYVVERIQQLVAAGDYPASLWSAL